MAKPIRPTEPTVPRLRPMEPAVRHLDPDRVAAALGAEPGPEHILGQPGPITLYALRSERLRRRQSSGGRPGLEGTSLRAKIPLPEQDWARLEDLAASLSTEGFSPSAGQVASVLLSLALRSLAAEPPGQVAARLAGELTAKGSSGNA
jgi:hypothetical protein